MTACRNNRTAATGGEYPCRTTPQSGRTQPIRAFCVQPTFQVLDFSLLRDFQRVIDLDPKVSNHTLQLGMAEQELDGQELGKAV